MPSKSKIGNHPDLDFIKEIIETGNLKIIEELNKKEIIYPNTTYSMSVNFGKKTEKKEAPILLKLAQEGHLDALRLLIFGKFREYKLEKFKYDYSIIDLKDSDGNGLLHAAVRGATLTRQDIKHIKKGYSRLETLKCCKERVERQKRIIIFLLRVLKNLGEESPCDLPNKFGNTPVAAIMLHLDFPFDPDMDQNSWKVRGWTKEEIEALEELEKSLAHTAIMVLPQEVNYRNNNNESLRDMAAGCGFTWLVKLLAEMKKMKFGFNKSGDTAIHLAAKRGHPITLSTLLSKYATEINATNKDKQTALHLAARGGHLFTVKLLLKKGADPNIKNKKGKTPIDIVREKYNRALQEVYVTSITLVVTKNENGRSKLDKAIETKEKFEGIIELLNDCQHQPSSEVESGFMMFSPLASNSVDFGNYSSQVTSIR